MNSEITCINMKSFLDKLTVKTVLKKKKKLYLYLSSKAKFAMPKAKFAMYLSVFSGSTCTLLKYFQKYFAPTLYYNCSVFGV